MNVKNKIVFILAFLAIESGIKAQTGGPGQPEFMQFKPVTATDLVNLSCTPEIVVVNHTGCGV